MSLSFLVSVVQPLLQRGYTYRPPVYTPHPTSPGPDNGNLDGLLVLALPVALGIVMLGLGMSLTVADFRRVVQYPRAVVIGLVCQMLLLPVVCVGICYVFGLPPLLSVGMMLLAASPGGATANLYSHLAKGDVALNITLTAINSVLAVVSMPLIVNWAFTHFMGSAGSLGMQFDKVVQTFALVLVPVAIGMLIRAKAPTFADRNARFFKLLSVFVLLFVIIGAILKNWQLLADNAAELLPATLAFNLLSMGVGFFVPLLLKVETRQSIAIGMEIGIHNGTLAITIALSVLQNEPLAVPAGVYSILMFFTAAAFGVLVARRVKS